MNQEIRGPARRHSRAWMLLASLAGVGLFLGFGLWLGELQAVRDVSAEQGRLLGKAEEIARSLNPAQARRLSFTFADVNSDSAIDIHYQLVAYSKTLPGQELFTIGSREGKLLYGPGGESKDQPGRPLASLVTDQLPFAREVFQDRKATVSGYMALAPVVDPRSDAVVLVVGLVSDPKVWPARLTSTRLESVGMSLLLLAVLVAGVVTVRWYSRLNGRYDRWVHRWTPPLLLLVGFTLTAVMAFHLAREAEDVAKVRFAVACSEVEIRILARLTSHEQILRSGAAFLESSDRVTRQEWRRFTERQNIDVSMPGIQGLGVAYAIAGEALAGHEAAVRAEGFPDYVVRPAGRRDFYTSIVYLEPFSGRNLRAFGYDMYSEPVRREAMVRAADNDVPALSGKVTLVQETTTNVQAGTLMYVPVYRRDLPLESVADRRKALIGWVYSPYRMGDLLSGILGSSGLGAKAALRLRIFDGEQTSPEALLFDSAATESKPAANGVTEGRTLSIPMISSGRLWTLNFSTNHPATLLEFDQVWSVGLSGGGISLLLFGLWYSLLGTRQRANRLAADLTFDVSEREARIRLLLDSTAEGIYGVDLEGNCTFCNASCVSLLGYSRPEDLLGKNMHWLIHAKRNDGSPYPVEECGIDQAVHSNQKCHVDNEVFWRADGTPFAAEYWSHPENLDGMVLGAVVSFLDISERKKAEAENLELNRLLQRTQKLESVGVLAGGLGHDFNNLLAGMAGNIELAKIHLRQNKPTEAAARLERIDKVFDRARNLARQLLTFSKGGAPVRERQNLGPLIGDWVDFAVSGSSMIPHLEVAPDLWPCLCDAQQISQIVDNFLINAKQVTPMGGTLKVRAFNVPGATPRVRIDVSDQGPGIPPEILDKIFDPFFSTKTGGSGLGLAIAYSIAHQHGGHIEVATEPGRGSTFSLLLPAVDAPGGPGVPDSDEDFQGSGWALIMDDEEPLRDALGSLLETFGFEVLRAKDGEEALALVEQAQREGKALNLILLDLTIPGGMGGWETVRRLLALGTTTTTVVMSGYSEEAAPQGPEAAFVRGRLIKPFRRRDLARLLRSLT